MSTIYLMVTKNCTATYADVLLPYEIIYHIDWSDCSDEEIKVYAIDDYEKEPEELEVYGAWHNLKDPLYIKVTRKDGTIEFDGYGTDH